MLIPSIDLMGGRIVQLVHGKELRLAFDDFSYWIDRFKTYPLVQLIDLDAAMRRGNNRAMIQRIASALPCQVGGGISSIEKAQSMLDAGAKRVIVGSALFQTVAHTATDPIALVNVDFAEALATAVGGERVVAGVDTKDGRVAIKGWTESVALTASEAMLLLEPYCGAFLYTHIDKEGTMQGFPYDIAWDLRSRTKRQLIAAGGIREQFEIDRLHAIGVDAVAGMAIYTGVLQT